LSKNQKDVLTMPKEAGKILEARDEVRHIVDLIHYATRPARVETPEFSKNKEILHQKIKDGLIDACFINNGHCEGRTEIHHFYVEYSAWTAILLERVQKVIKIEAADDMEQLIPICHKHHMGVGTGIHFVTINSWYLQKFMSDESIALFEAAVTHLKEVMHPNHATKGHKDQEADHAAINAKATAVLVHLAAKEAA
jgi:hypothetical protein